MRAVLLVAGLVSSTAALAADSVTTPLDLDTCEVVEIATEDEAGEPLAKEDQYPVYWRCAGLGDRFVYIGYDDERESLALGSKEEAATHPMRHGHFGSWGPTVEWRGMKTETGQLEPQAAIVKYGWHIPKGNDDGSDEVGGELGVLRIGKGDADTCLMAWVDTVANTDAVEVARKAADEATAGYACPKLADEDADAAEGAGHLGKVRDR